MANLFDTSNPRHRAGQPDSGETIEPLVTGRDTLIERIVSVGHTTPPGQWYDQNRDEWVVVLQGEAILAYDDGSRTKLAVGDYVLIPARRKHRVEYTSSEPPCLWLAVHASLQPVVRNGIG